jgi:hypothetical protein
MSKSVDMNRFEETLERKVTGKELRRIELFQELYEYVKPISGPEASSNSETLSEYTSEINKLFKEQYNQETYGKFMSRHYFSQELRK